MQERIFRYQREKSGDDDRYNPNLKKEVKVRSDILGEWREETPSENLSSLIIQFKFNNVINYSK